MGNWISVEGALPPLDEDVLVFSHGQISVCSLVRLDYETADLVWEDAYGFWDNDEGISAVSYWMPLPESPKERKHERVD